VNDPRSPTDTCIACLTPPGQAALATLALHGACSWQAVRSLFRLRSGTELPAAPQTGRFWLGCLGAETADEVVVAVKSIEPVPLLEIHCHGGREVVRYLLELFQERGLRLCTWQELARRLDEDSLRAAAQIVLAQAPTTRTAAILLDQMHGALACAFEEIRTALERFDLPAAQRGLSELASRIGLGRHLTSPWRVVVAGAPNVGKSSLVNALAGFQRSVVAATPGTTRDVVTTRLAIEGWPVELVDTAGLRTAAEALEEQGMDQARAEVTTADLCLWLLDASAPPIWPEQSAASVRLIVNKVDLRPIWDLTQAAEAIHVSAQTGSGLAELCVAMGRWLVPETPPPGAAVPFTASLCEGVETAMYLVSAGEVEEALSALGAS
jgi:tRNA modification GTPase